MFSHISSLVHLTQATNQWYLTCDELMKTENGAKQLLHRRSNSFLSKHTLAVPSKQRFSHHCNPLTIERNESFRMIKFVFNALHLAGTIRILYEI